MNSNYFQHLFLLMLLVTCGATEGAETVKCTFECRKFMTRAEAATGGLPPRATPMSDCHVYCFWAKGQGVLKEYTHFTDSPEKTDSKGLCLYPFKRSETYYIYFCGRELSKSEVKDLAEKRSHVLQRVVMQPRTPLSARDNEPEVAAYQRNHLKVTLRQSFARWISRLHHVESRIASPTKVLTSVRKLLYDNKHWDTLIDRSSIAPLYKFDRGTGQILMSNDLELDKVEDLSDRHKRAGEYKYDMNAKSTSASSGFPPDQTYRTVLERNEFVTLPDGRILQIFHVLAGIESQLFEPAFNFKTVFGIAPEDALAAVTWSGDLAQAVCHVRPEATSGEIPKNSWKSALTKKSSESELVGDIAGVYLGGEKGKDLAAGTPLSQVLEDAFYTKDWASNAAEHFRKRYPNATSLSETVEDFAVRWCGSFLNKAGWYFNRSGAIESELLKKSIEELNRILEQMSTTLEPSPKETSKLYFLQDVRSGLQFEQEYREVIKTPQRLATSKDSIRKRFDSTLPDNLFSTPSKFTYLRSRSRLPRDQETFVELMNLDLFKEQLDGAANDASKAQDILKQHKTLLSTTLFRSTEPERLFTVKEVRNRLKMISRLRTQCLQGVDPDNGPSVAEANQQLLASGFPDVVPYKVTVPQQIRVRRGDQTEVFWAVNVDCDLGTGEGMEPIIQSLPIASYRRIKHTAGGDRHIETGFLLDLKVIANFLDERLTDFTSKERTIAHGNTNLTLSRLWFRNGEVVADWTFKLPGETNKSLMLTRVRPRVVNGRLEWFGRAEIDRALELISESDLSDELSEAVEFRQGKAQLNRALSNHEATVFQDAVSAAALRKMSPKIQMFAGAGEVMPVGQYALGVQALELPDELTSLCTYSQTTGFLTIHAEPNGENALILRSVILRSLRVENESKKLPVPLQRILRSGAEIPTGSYMIGKYPIVIDSSMKTLCQYLSQDGVLKVTSALNRDQADQLRRRTRNALLFSEFKESDLTSLQSAISQLPDPMQDFLGRKRSLPVGKYITGGIRLAVGPNLSEFCSYSSEKDAIEISKDLTANAADELRRQIHNAVFEFASQACLGVRGETSSLLDAQEVRTEVSPTTFKDDVQADLTGVPIAEIPDGVISFVRFERKDIRGPPLSDKTKKALQPIESKLQTDPSAVRKWKPSIDAATLESIEEGNVVAEFDCVIDVDSPQLQGQLRVGPVIALKDGRVTFTRRTVTTPLVVGAVRVVSGARRHHEEVRKHLSSLQSELRAKPGQILEWSKDPAGPDDTVICVAEVVVTSPNATYAIGPIHVKKVNGNLTVALSRASVHKFDPNLDILTSYVSNEFRFFVEDGAIPKVRIRDVDLRLQEGHLLVKADWSVSSLREPVRLDFRLPISPGSKFNAAEVFRAALSHQQVVFGPHLAVTFGDLDGRDDWPAVLKVGDSKISTAIQFDDGSWRIEFHGKDLGPLLPESLRRGLTAIGVSKAPEVSGIRIHVADDGSSSAVLAKLAWDLDVTNFSVDIRIDRFGIHVRSMDGLATQLAQHALKKISGWPVRVSRISVVDNEIHFDAQLLIDDSPALSFFNARLVGGALNVGAVKVSPEFAGLWSGGAAFRTLQIANVRFDKQAVVCDATVNLPPFSPIHLENVSLRGDRRRVEELFEACVPQVLAALRPSKTVDFGGFSIAAEPDLAQRKLKISAELKDPRVAISWPSTTLSHDGLTLGPGQLIQPSEPQLRKDLALLFEKAAGVRSGGVSVDSVSVVGNRIADIGVEFTVSVDLPSGRVSIKGNRITAAGITLGKLPNLKDVAQATVSKAIDEFASWAVGAEISIGVASLKVTAADRQSRTAEGLIFVQGREIGGVLADFSGSGKPKISLKDPDAFIKNIAGQTPLGDFSVAGANAVRIASTELEKKRIVADVEFLAPILNEYVPIGSVVVCATGIQFEANKDWEGALWKNVAQKLDGKSFDDDAVPVKLTVAKATAISKGIELDLNCSVDGLGEFALTDIRLDGNGLKIDEQAVFTNLANLVTKKVQEALGDSVCTLEGIRVVDDAVEITVILTVDGLEPFPLTVSIGRDGSLRGFDSEALLALVLAELTSELEGKSFELPGNIKLTITGAVPAPDLKGVNVSGSIVAFDAVTASVENVLFTGRSFNTKQMKLTDFKVAGLSEALGLADLGDNGIAIKNFGPMLGKNGQLTGITLTASCKIAEVLEAEIDASIGEKGVKVQLPITLVATNGFMIPIPPCFALTRPKAQIAEAYLGVGCSLGLSIPKSEKLIRIDGLLKFPLKPPRQISAEADLVLLGFLKPGHSEVVLDLDESELRALMVIDLFGVMSFDGRFLARMKPSDFLLEGNGELIFLGSELASGYMKIDAVVFVGNGQLSILGVKAKANLDGKWKPLDATVTAEVGFDLPGVGRIAGADVSGNPKKGAAFGVTILSRPIKIASVDFTGITKERILDVLFQDSIIPTGLKLLATEGGGGSVTVEKDGSLVKKDPTTQSETRVSANEGTIVLTRRTLAAGGNPDDGDLKSHVFNEDRIVPAANTVVRRKLNSKGESIDVPERRPYVEDSKVDEEKLEELFPSGVKRRDNQ